MRTKQGYRMGPRRIAVLSTLGMALLGTSACGGAARAPVSPGPMPQGGTFTGVWFSPQYGEMHMVQQGAAVVGRYVKDERSGRIQGTAEGNLLRFGWEELRELVAGRPTKTQGRGYFQYQVGADGKHNILGEWGLDDSEVGGGEWNAYKLKRRQPEVEPTTSGSEEGDAEPWDEPANADEEPLEEGSGSGGTDDDLDLDDLEL